MSKTKKQDELTSSALDYQENQETRRALMTLNEFPPSRQDRFESSHDQTFDMFDQELDQTYEHTFDQTIDESLDEASNEIPEPFTLQLPLNGVFQELSDSVKKSLIKLGTLINYSVGAELNIVGDPCRGLSFIISGRVKVEWMDALGWEPIAQMDAGGVFGVLEWAEGKIWEERITAVEPTSILFISTQKLHSLIITYPDLQRQTARYTERHQLHTLLGVNPIFQEVSELDLMRLVDLATLRYAEAGTLLFSPQMILALLFVIGRGEVELSVDDRVIQVLERGDLVNLEFSLGDVSQILTAKVSSDATLYVLPFDEIELLLSKNGNLGMLRRQAHLLRARALNE